MDNNKDSSWLLKGSLKDWALVIAAIWWFVSAQSSIASLQKDVTENNALTKEINKDMSVWFREIELRQSQFEVQLQILKKEVEALKK